MNEERSTFETTKARLEDIVAQVRRKDVSLEASLDLLEEAVRLVNQCNDLIDQTSWRSSTGSPDAGAAEPAPDEPAGETAAEDPQASAEDATAGAAADVAVAESEPTEPDEASGHDAGDETPADDAGQAGDVGGPEPIEDDARE